VVDKYTVRPKMHVQVEDPRVAPSPQDCGYYPVPPGRQMCWANLLSSSLTIDSPALRNSSTYCGLLYIFLKIYGAICLQIKQNLFPHRSLFATIANVAKEM
jgi:hypothetical protein